MSGDDQDSTAAEALSDGALRALARVAGDGEMRAHAVRQLEKSRAAIELEGWLLLQEIRLDDRITIRHGLVGPGGVVVSVPCGPVPKFEHLAESERQANALAQLLRLDRHAIVAALVTMDSDEAPSEQHYDGYSAVVLGDRRLSAWLSDLPTVIGSETLSELRDAIYERAARAAEAKPLRLPDEPLQG